MALGLSACNILIETPARGVSALILQLKAPGLSVAQNDASTLVNTEAFQAVSRFFKS
jgi:hypothetical protein